MARYNWRRRRQQRPDHGTLLDYTRMSTGEDIVISYPGSETRGTIELSDLTVTNISPVTMENTYIKAQDVRFDDVFGVGAISADNLQDAIEELDRENRELKARVEEIAARLGYAEVQLAETQT